MNSLHRGMTRAEVVIMPRWIWFFVAVLIVLAVIILWVEHVNIHVH